MSEKRPFQKSKQTQQMKATRTKMDVPTSKPQNLESELHNNKFCALEEDELNNSETEKQLDNKKSNSAYPQMDMVNILENKQNEMDDKGWTLYKPKTKNNTINKNISTIPLNTTPKEELTTKLKLKETWNVLTHVQESSDWSRDSYKIIYKIDSIETFWQFFNNINKLDYQQYQFYIMRSTSWPTWEDPSNRNGGTCSIRLSKEKLFDVVEQLAILILNESFNDIPEEINGLSFGIKINWGLIKIWNNNCDHDISTFVPQYISKKYGASPRYKKNEPEY